MKRKGSLFVCILVAIIGGIQTLPPERVFALDRYVLGGVEHPWSDSWKKTGSTQYITSNPGWISSFKADSTQNLATGALERGGYVRNTASTFDDPELKNMIDGDKDTKLSYQISIGTFQAGFCRQLWIDLGAAFVITRIRFYPGILKKGDPAQFPKTFEFSRRFVSDFTISFNDGDPTKTGPRSFIYYSVGNAPLFTPVLRVTQNKDPVFDVAISPPQVARYIELAPDCALRAWEIAEWEVYGQGFVPSASYVSDIIDLGDIASWGTIKWEGIAPKAGSKAKVLIQTRSGNDDDPNIYWRKTGTSDEESPYAESGQLLTKKDYESLSVGERGRITYDYDNWSPWSAPYPFEAGSAPIVSPGPRRYIQIKVDFANTTEEGGSVKTVEFDYSKPPSASELVGEVFPTQVTLGNPVTFTYVVKPSFRGNDTGFDSIEITTPVPVKTDAIKSVKIDGKQVNFSAESFDNPSRFVVHFPEDQISPGSGRKLLELQFESMILRYGTAFDGWVFHSQKKEVYQRINPGDVSPELPDNTLSVKATLGSSLIGSVKVSAKTITPNKDGLNDNVKINFDLLQLTKQVPVRVKIYNLSGVAIKTVYDQDNLNGQFSCTWDGTDDNGKLIPPGLYIYQIEVNADSGKQTKMGSINVAY